MRSRKQPSHCKCSEYAELGSALPRPNWPGGSPNLKDSTLTVSSQALKFLSPLCLPISSPRQEDGCSGVDFMIRTGSTPVSFFSLHLFQSGGYVLQKRQIHRLTHVKLRRLSHHPRYPASGAHLPALRFVSGRTDAHLIPRWVPVAYPQDKRSAQMPLRRLPFALPAQYRRRLSASPSRGHLQAVL